MRGAPTGLPQPQLAPPAPDRGAVGASDGGAAGAPDRSAAGAPDRSAAGAPDRGATRAPDRPGEGAPAGAGDGAGATGVRPRIRVLSGGEIALGPGKVAVLAAVAEHGSLVDAARALGMSYMRAWRLVQTMNACFRQPLVETRRGGRVHGGAALTAAGAAVLQLYRRMERDSLAAMAAAWEELRGFLA